MNERRTEAVAKSFLTLIPLQMTLIYKEHQNEIMEGNLGVL